jgi:GH24 family phage-related lysozyme (muramidase)
MPVVPTSVAPSVQPTSSTGIPYQTAAGATPDAFGAGIGQAEQGLARQLEATGDIAAKHALQMQEDVNASSAKDLFLQADVETGKLTVDYNALEGANRVNAYPQYIKDLGAVREKYKQLAPNTDVAKRFDQDFARRVGYSIVDGARSAATANKQYQSQQNSALQTNALSHVAANADDDKRFNTELGIGLSAVRSGDDYKGAAPEVQKEHEQAFTTQAWATRLQSMAKSDPLRARDLFNKNKGQIDGLTQLKLDDSINQQIINVQSRVDSDKIIQNGAFVPADLAERVKKLEGYSEKPYADFKQTSSGYGTKAQPGDESIPPDQRRAVYESRLYNELGRAANIVDNFAPGLPKGTRDALISLTYNAGSAWTSSGLGHKIQAGDLEGAKANFGQYINAGDRPSDALINRRATELSWWGGDARDANPESQMATALQHAKEQAIKTFPDDPANQAKYLDTLQNRLKTDFNVMQQSARDMQLQTRNVVQRELFDPDHHVIDYDHLSSAAKAAYDVAPPMLKKSFDDAMKRNSTADVPLTAARQDRFDTLRGESINEPDKFMSRDISNEDLPRPQKSILLKAQADRKALVERGGKLQTAMTAIQPLLNDAGIGKSATDQSKNAEYNKFGGVMEQRLDAFYQEKKRPPTDKETQEIGQALLKDVVTGPGWFGNRTERTYSAIANKTPIAVKSVDEARALPSGATFVLNGETRTRK